MSLTILYRGLLKSCNYGCLYCPFAKSSARADELAADQAALARFVTWACQQAMDPLSVFFTPAGEALIHPGYQRAIATLTQAPRIRKVAIQTNLSFPVDWLEGCDRHRLGLWCTFHPSQECRSAFVSRCRQLSRMGVRYSVGAVGVRENLDEIERLRADLPSDVYLWVNAYKRVDGYYAAGEVRRLTAIDPLFRFSCARHASRGRSCQCGQSVVSVDGHGTVRRCHFIPEPLGNLYCDPVDQMLLAQPCPNAVCGCHIGYVHLDYLRLADVFGGGLLERIPSIRPE